MLIQRRAISRHAASVGACAGGWACLVGLLSISGCSGGEKLPTVPASGTVTYNGEPLAGATINLVPKAEGSEGQGAMDAKGASGETDAQGRFSMQTYLGGNRTVPGALPGEYLVSVVKRENINQRLGPGGEGAAKVREEAIDKAKNAPPAGGPPGGGPPGRGGPPMGGQPANPNFMSGRLEGKSLIPENYGSPMQSGFTATIGAAGNKDLKFELKD